MTATLSFFPVGNGDMTLLETESGRKILIDLNIRAEADDPDNDTPDVARALRKRLECDSDGRLYVDSLLVSHPDQDHCTGLRKHFHLGPPSKGDYIQKSRKGVDKYRDFPVELSCN